jgi:hypothetical protein
MADLLLAEDLLDGMILKLRAGMPARVARINDQKDDGLVLVPPKDEMYFDGRMPNLPETPAIFVMEGPTTFKKEGSHSFLNGTDVVVYVFESDQNGLLLARRLRRQVRAVIETLWDDVPLERLNGNTYHLTPRRTIPGGSLTDPKSPDEWRGFTAIVFRAEQTEN